MSWSAPCLPGEPDVEPDTDSNPESGLLKLSPEIRLLIYGHIFQDQLVHLSNTRRGLESTVCPKFNCQICERRINCPNHVPREEKDSADGDDGSNCPPEDEPPNTIFSVLWTCNLIYHEASHVMYSMVTFDIRQLAAGISFFRTCPRAGLSRVRRLQIHYKTAMIPARDTCPANAQYCEFWGLVAFCMPSLRDLHFCMEVRSLGFNKARDMDFQKRWPGWAIPILYARGLKSCELTVDVEGCAARGVVRRLDAVNYPELMPLRQKCLEDMQQIMCQQPGRQTADFSGLFLGPTFPQEDHNALKALLKDRYMTALPPDSEREARVSDVSIGILRSELYQPDIIPAHRDNPDLTRKRANGNLYVNDTIEWLVQKGDELPVKRRIVLERVARKQKHISKIRQELEIYTSDTMMESHYGKSHPKNQGATHCASKTIRLSNIRSYRVQQTAAESESEEVEVRKTFFKLPYEIIFWYDGDDISTSALPSLDWYVHHGASPLIRELREPLDWGSVGISRERLLSLWAIPGF